MRDDRVWAEQLGHHFILSHSRIQLCHYGNHQQTNDVSCKDALIENKYTFNLILSFLLALWRSCTGDSHLADAGGLQRPLGLPHHTELCQIFQLVDQEWQRLVPFVSLEIHHGDICTELIIQGYIDEN